MKNFYGRILSSSSGSRKDKGVPLRKKQSNTAPLGKSILPLAALGDAHLHCNTPALAGGARERPICLANRAQVLQSGTLRGVLRTSYKIAKKA